MSLPVLFVLGTHNPHKLVELNKLLQPDGYKLATLEDFPNSIDVEETGETFAENARLKAVEQARHLGQWVIGEDSGVSVDALGGAPGVYSKRYAGEEGDDDQNNRKLLKELEQTPWERRSAHYTCHIAVADPTGEIRGEVAGICRGRIRFNGAGEEGFGYDPLFEILECHQTFGQLGPSVKGMISHRARAIRGIAPVLRRLARQS